MPQVSVEQAQFPLTLIQDASVSFVDTVRRDGGLLRDLSSWKLVLWSIKSLHRLALLAYIRRQDDVETTHCLELILQLCRKLFSMSKELNSFVFTMVYFFRTTCKRHIIFYSVVSVWLLLTTSLSRAEPLTDSPIYFRMASIGFVKTLNDAPLSCVSHSLVPPSSATMVKLNVRTRANGTVAAVGIAFAPNSEIGSYLATMLKEWRFRPTIIGSRRHPVVSSILIYLLSSESSTKFIVAGYHDEAVTLSYCDATKVTEGVTLK